MQSIADESKYAVTPSRQPVAPSLRFGISKLSESDMTCRELIPMWQLAL
jgi:hypothetical protein